MLSILLFPSSVDKIAASIENISNEQISDPFALFKSPDKIYSMSFHREFLIIGSVGHIHGYSVSSSGIIKKKDWSILLPISPEACEMSEVNDLWVDAENDLIYAGCGDSNIYVCSLEDGTFLRKLTGHKDYIHSVHGFDKLVVSASEDGSVNFYDQREKNVSFTLEPHKNANINRPNFGHWIGSASINNEWVATGGGPRLALYHLRNRQPFQIFDFPKEIHVTSFIEDNLLAGGEANVLATYSLTGDTISEIVTSGPSVLSVAWQKTPNCKILTACGASNKIDVTTNFNYKDTTLNFYGKKF